jgi:hypothetical protein
MSLLVAEYIWVVIAGLLSLLSLVVSLWRFKGICSDRRSFDDYVQEIRAMNTYNSYFISAIIVFLALVLDKGMDKLPHGSLNMLLIALFCSAFSVFFFPIRKPRPGAPSLGIRIRWVCVLIPAQWTVILVTCAALNAFLTSVSQAK